MIRFFFFFGFFYWKGFGGAFLVVSCGSLVGGYFFLRIGNCGFYGFGLEGGTLEGLRIEGFGFKYIIYILMVLRYSPFKSSTVIEIQRCFFFFMYLTIPHGNPLLI